MENEGFIGFHVFENINPEISEYEPCLAFLVVFWLFLLFLTIYLLSQNWQNSPSPLKLPPLPTTERISHRADGSRLEFQAPTKIFPEDKN